MSTSIVQRNLHMHTTSYTVKGYNVSQRPTSRHIVQPTTAVHGASRTPPLLSRDGIKRN